MSQSPVEFLHHVIDEIAFLNRDVHSAGEDRFMQDDTLQRAAARSLEIIGEAIKQIPDDFRSKNTEIDWKSFSGLRDKLIHHYFGIDYAIVWDVIIHELPRLRENLESLITSESS